jgi:hypothetical protein
LQQPVPHGGNPEEIRLYNEFITARRTAEASSVFAHVDGKDGGRFPLTGVGDVNTYALFSETISQLTAPTGRAGFIVPTGIATDDSTKQFFAALAEGGRLTSLFDFENREALFSSVHRSFKFCTLTLGATKASEFAFFLAQTEQLGDERRRFSLAAEDFKLINPNTRTCPVFRSRTDAELTRAIYRRVPVLIEEERDGQPEKNPWGVQFSQGLFNMTSDSSLFSSQSGAGRLPLYEAKMIHQFDHRWATYGSGGGEDGAHDLGPEQKANPNQCATPRYWVSEREVLARLAEVPRSLSKAWIAEDDTEAQRVLQHWVHASRHPAAGFAMEDTLFAPRSASGFTPDPKLDAEVRKAPLLSTTELAWLEDAPLPEALHRLHDTRSPRWLTGWRDITNATNERTVIASVLPRAGVGNNLPIMLLPQDGSAALHACLLGCLTSLALDFVARHKVGGTHLNYFIYKQLPVLPPEAYSGADLAFIVPRVLELTYTAHDMRAWAEEVTSSYNARFPETPLVLPEAPYGFVPERRAELRAELDAKYARLYGLSRDELRYILDPADTHGADYPSETFRVLKNNELRHLGEYRTQRLVLEAWDRMETP